MQLLFLQNQGYLTQERLHLQKDDYCDGIFDGLRIVIIFNPQILILLMSEQADGLLDHPSSFNFHREKVSGYRKSSIDPQNFHLWVRNDMYRSSYAHHHSPESLQPRSGHIPGYGGFIPNDRAQSLQAKTYASMTKDVFKNPNFGANLSGLATTGFNIAKDALIDKSKAASSHKYGKSQIQTPHPAWIPKNWISTTKDTYLDPNAQQNPTERETDKYLQTSKMKTKQSGFQRDRAYLDGNGWKPNPILNPANLTSQYRDRFNPQMEFHRKVAQQALPQLKKTEYKYKFNL